MVSLFRKSTTEPDLDNRIAGLARRRLAGQAAEAADMAPEPMPPPEVKHEPASPVALLNGASAAAQTEPTDRPRGEAAPPRSEHVHAPEPMSAPDPDPIILPTRTPAPAGPASTPFVVRPVDRPAMPAGMASTAQRPSVPPPDNSGQSLEAKLEAARAQLISRLSGEIRPERRSLLSRGELAKLVDAAVQAHFVRNAINADPLARRDLVTAILHELLNPGSPDSETLSNRRMPRRALVEAAKAQIQPLVLEHMDVAAAAEMPRPAFEAQLTGWVKELLAETKIQLNFAEQRELVESLIADMLGLGPLEPLMADETVTDIMVNGAKQVYIERRGKLELADVQFRDDQHVMNVATKIVSRIGRRIDEAKPLVDARLEDGSRVNIIIPPLALDGPSISIRKFAKKTITLDIMAQNGSISTNMATVLKIAARCRLNILISGGTGSGKTTLLNAMSRMIDPAERTVTIEDAAELQLQQPHVVRLETRPANLEGSGEITMRDLLKNALRMRPDRIIIGECRGEEAMDMLQAMNTGHDGSMSTIHANNPREALTRMENMISMGAVNLPSKAMRTQIASAINMICQVSRMRDGARRVTHIVEVVGMEGDIITTQELFNYQFQGETGEGRLRGTFQSTGIRPSFLPRAEYFGLDRALLEAI
ncbi:MAG TPA: ATPase, T2SS/T4P/T4SS family [Stellaceae bacterium]|jgi:pilus assembly protein CpaF|nr:ATPase, T2SS/T4P/T4SS family [Stellaceae bacterium]